MVIGSTRDAASQRLDGLAATTKGLIKKYPSVTISNSSAAPKSFRKRIYYVARLPTRVVRLFFVMAQKGAKLKGLEVQRRH